MSQSKRLHFKDIDALRFFALLPVFIFCTLYLTQTENEGFHYELTTLFRYIKQNSFDFFFFISAFLLTSQGLREYKYTDTFSLRNFYLRRIFRITPLLIVAIVFAFLVHPWIMNTLKLHSLEAPSGNSYLMFVPNYFGIAKPEQYVYLAVIWTIYMFLQFYIVWGIVLRYFKNMLPKIAVTCLVIGVASRIVRLVMNLDFEFDTFAYGVPVGLGVILAKMIREDSQYLEKIKQIPKKLLLPIYFTGLALILFLYVISDNFIYVSIVPFITCSFYAFVIIDQTFGKNAGIKFRNNKVFTHLGKISFGILVYQSVIGVMVIIGIDSLDFEIDSLTVKTLFAVIVFAISWITADLSYNFIEKPLLRLRREFKTV